jgi:hypothetical protein
MRTRARVRLLGHVCRKDDVMTQIILNFPVRTVPPLRCVWVETGNPAQPLTCKWISAQSAEIVDEPGFFGLCA